MIKDGLNITQIANAMGVPLEDVIKYRIETNKEREHARKASLIPQNFRPDTDYNDLKSFLECMRYEKPFPHHINCESNRYVYLLKIMNERSEGVLYNRIMGQVNKNEKILAMFEKSAEFYGTKNFTHELIDLETGHLITVRSDGNAPPLRYALDVGGTYLMNYLKKNCKKL